MDKTTRRGRPTKAQAAEIRHAKETIAAITAAAKARKHETRSKAMKKWHRGRRLKKSDPNFFKILGRKGGKKTAERMGSEYFRAIAVLGHQTCRERAAEAERLAAEQARNGKR